MKADSDGPLPTVFLCAPAGFDQRIWGEIADRISSSCQVKTLSWHDDAEPGGVAGPLDVLRVARAQFGSPDVVVADGLDCAAAVTFGAEVGAAALILVNPAVSLVFDPFDDPPPGFDVDLDPEELLARTPTAVTDAVARRHAQDFATAVAETFRHRLPDRDVALIRAIVHDHAEFWLAGAVGVAPAPPDWRQRLGEYAGEVLVLVSSGVDAEEENASVHTGRVIAEEAPRGRLVKVAAETEFPWLEQVDETSETILALLRGLPDSLSE